MTDIIIPTEDELMQPVKTNVLCSFAGCGRTFKHSAALQMHLVETHKQKGLVAYGRGSKQNKTKVYHCPIASCKYHTIRSFPTLYYVRQHYQKVHAEKKFPCNKCQRKFGAQKLLEAHEKVCGVVFTCPSCQTPYSTKEALQTHFSRQHFQTLKFAAEKPMIINDEGEAPSSNASQYGHEQTTPRQKYFKIAPKIPIDRTNITTQTCPPELPLNSADHMSITTQTGPPEPPLNSVESSTQTDVLRRVVQSCGLMFPPGVDHSLQVGLPISSQTSCTYSQTVPVNTNFYTVAATQTALPALLVDAGSQCISKPPTDGTHGQLDDSQWDLYDEAFSVDTRNVAVTSCFSEYSTQSNVYQTQSSPDTSFNIGKIASSIEDSPAMEALNNDDSHSFVNSSLTHLTKEPTVTHLGTQTFLGRKRYLSSSEFGTQTTSTSEVEAIEKSSIELQCDIGINTLQQQPSSSDLELSSFGTQTVTKSFSVQTDSDTSVDSAVGLESSQLLLPQCEENNLKDCLLPIPQSTSDFSMQFSCDRNEFSDFGTQTSLLPDFDFIFSDVNLSTSRSNIELSQSSTQTDLDFLFTNIQTQTDVNETYR